MVHFLEELLNRDHPVDLLLCCEIGVKVVIRDESDGLTVAVVEIEVMCK